MKLKIQFFCFLFFFLAYVCSWAQPFYHTYQASFFTFGQEIVPLDEGRYIVGGQNGLFMGYPSFAPFLMMVDNHGEILFQREMQDHWNSELGGINGIVINPIDSSIYVAVEVSGCDYGVPGALYQLDQLGNTIWYQEVQQADALAIFSDGSAVVGGNYTGLIRRYHNSGDLIWERDVALWINDLTTVEDTLFVLGQYELARVDESGEVQGIWEFGEGLGQQVKYWPSQKRLMVRAEDKLYQMDRELNQIAEVSLDLYGQFESMAFDSSHCYLLGRGLDAQRMVIVFDTALNYVADFPVGNAYQVATNFVVDGDQLIIVGDEVPDPFEGIANTAMWERPYQHRGSALFIQTYDLNGTATPLKTDVALTRVELAHISDPVNNGMCYWPESDVYSYTIEGIRVKVANEGTEVLNDLSLNIRFDPCSFICPTATTFIRSFSNLNIQPGQTTELGFGNIDVFYVPLESSVNLCVWPSVPNGKLDANPENNEVCEMFLVTSTEEEMEARAVRVFPNPANDLLIVDWGMDISNIQTITLLDNVGRILDLRDWNELHNGLELDISRLPQGIYYLKISTGGQQFSARFIKM